MDPMEIYGTVMECIEQCCNKLRGMGIATSDIKAVGYYLFTWIITFPGRSITYPLAVCAINVRQVWYGTVRVVALFTMP